MKQKKLMAIRALICLVLTAILGILCLCPLFSINVKVSDEAADVLSKVVERKKIIEVAEDVEEIEKISKPYDELISKIQASRYYDIYYSLDLLAEDIINDYNDSDKSLPYGFESEEEVTKWVDELKELYEEEMSDENRAAWDIKYALFKNANEDKEKLEKELTNLVKEIKTPSVLSRLKEDSLGYECSLSITDFLSFKSFIMASILVDEEWSIYRKTKEIASLSSTSDSEKYLKLMEEILNAELYLSQPESYEGVTVEALEKAIGIKLLFLEVGESCANIGESFDVEYYDNMLYAKKEYSLMPLWSVILIIIVAIILLVVIITTFFKVFKLVFRIGKREAFFKATTKKFVKTSITLLCALFLLVCVGAKLTTYGIIMFVLIVLGFVAFAVSARCTALPKNSGNYLNLVQLVGLISVIGMSVVLFTGKSFITSTTTSQSMLTQAIMFGKGELTFTVVSVFISMFACLLVFVISLHMHTGLKRLACMYNPKAQTEQNINGANPRVANVVLCTILVIAYTALSVMGMKFNVVGLIIGIVMVIVAEIVLSKLSKKEAFVVSEDVKDDLNVYGMKYFDPESLVVAPFVSVASDEKATDENTQQPAVEKTNEQVNA